jgi:hypothetical protein
MMLRYWLAALALPAMMLAASALAEGAVWLAGVMS